MAGGSARDPFACIHLDEFPVVPFVDVARVVINLRFVAVLLVFMVCADTGISRNPALPLLIDWSGCELLAGSRNRDNVLILCHCA